MTVAIRRRIPQAYEIADGHAGTWQTLSVMRALARAGADNAILQRASLEIPVENIDAYLRSVWRFVPEEEETLRGVEQQVDHYITHNELIGDCDDAAIVAAALCIAKSIRSRVMCRFVAVRSPANTEFEHVFVEWFAPRPGLVIRIDPTAPVEANYTGWERMEMAL